MNSSKKWIHFALLGSLFSLYLLPTVFRKLSAPTDYVQISPTGFSYTESSVVSSVLGIIIVLLSVWISLYVGSRMKTKLINQGASRLRSMLLPSIVATIVFALICFVLPYSLIDNRTAEGYVAFIDLESIGHFVYGGSHMIYVALVGLLL